MTDDGAYNLCALADQFGVPPTELARRMTPEDMRAMGQFYRRRDQERKS